MIERLSPTRVRYVAGQATRNVKLFTFCSDDDSNIKEGSRTFLLTCSRAAYPELRLYFTRQLGAFVARINQGVAENGSPWNDIRCNTENFNFCRILSGVLGRDTELFIVPLKRDDRRVWAPVGGVRFLSNAHAGRASRTKGYLNLISGWNDAAFTGLMIDSYFGVASGNDLVKAVADL